VSHYFPVDNVNEGFKKGPSKENNWEVLMDIPHRQKVQRLIEELGQQGIGPYTVAPPLFRFLWSLGLEIPPPFFLGFAKLTTLMGTTFGALWGSRGEPLCGCGYGRGQSRRLLRSR
jgi:hypothetical protein